MTLSQRRKPTSPAGTRQGTNSLDARLRPGNHREIRTTAAGGAVRILLLFLALTSHLALAVNSPRPASYRLQDHNLVLTWTNLNTAYPRTLSYRSNLTSAWQWETNRLWPDATGTLVVTRPVTEPAMFYRLWPATP